MRIIGDRKPRKVLPYTRVIPDRRSNRRAFANRLNKYRHCADAVISFATPSTVTGFLATRVLELLAHWVQSPSDFDKHIIRSMEPEWLEKYQPVISQASGHVMYTRLTPLLPGGQFLRCPKGCGQPFRHSARPEGIVVVCEGCNRRCTVPKVKDKTFLGLRQVMKVPYPLTPYITEWRSPPSTPSLVLTSPPEAPPTLPPTTTTLPKSVPTPLFPQRIVIQSLDEARSPGEPISQTLSRIPGIVIPCKRQSVQEFHEAAKRRR